MVNEERKSCRFRVYKNRWTVALRRLRQHLIWELFYDISQNDFLSEYVCAFKLSKPFQPGTKNNEPSQQEACSTFPDRTDTSARFFITALTYTQTYTVIKRTDQTHGCVRDVRRNRQRWCAPRALTCLRATVGCFCSGGDREGNRAEEASGGLFGCFLRLPLSDVTGNFSHSEAKHFKLSYFVKESYLSKQLVIVGQLIL